MAELLYLLLVTVLLGFQHLLYAAIYHYPNTFKKLCDRYTTSPTTTNRTKKEYWEYFRDIFYPLKAIQASVIFYDIGYVIERNPPTVEKLVLGVACMILGQTLNTAVFWALGHKGVFYGSELGYQVEFVTGFPFNLGISDPQYWGVILTVFGLYMAVGATSFALPMIEAAWYVAQMVLLENKPRSGQVLDWLRKFTGKSKPA